MTLTPRRKYVDEATVAAVLFIMLFICVVAAGVLIWEMVF